MKVYVVTVGEFSDYDVDAIFSTMEKAEKYQATHPDTHSDILEFEVDAYKTECEVYYGLEVSILHGKYHGFKGFRDTKPIRESFNDDRFRPPLQTLIVPVTKYYEYNSEVGAKVAQDAWAKYKYEHNITQ